MPAHSLRQKNSQLPLYSKGALFCLIFFETLLFLKAPFVGDFFYLLIWWPYILFIDGFLYKKNNWSILKTSPNSLISLIPWSVTIWLVFELFNISLNNWHYINLVNNLLIRWICYVVAFGTVLIGLFETFLLVRSFDLFNNIKTGLFTLDKRLKFILVATGIFFLFVSLASPKYCFPLVWGGFYLIIDPLKIIPQKNSLIYELSQGNPARTLQLLFAGAVCGFLWEFWNFWATAKWIYTVPFVGEIKLFEMPVLGFLGFPPFTLECFIMYNFLCAIGLAIPWDMEFNMDSYRKITQKDIIIFLLQIPFWMVSFYLIDIYSVESFK